MIRLTQSNGKTVRVQVEHIIAVEGDNQAEVKTLSTDYLVKESPEKVALMVLEYKLAIERYKTSIDYHSAKHPNADYAGNADNAQNFMNRLAGLE